MNIKSISTQELSIIQNLAHKIWFSAYHEIITVAQIEYMLEKIYSIQSLENQIKNGQKFVLVIENNEPVGFCSFEYNCQNSGKTKIHKLYVLPEMQGKSMGKFMMEYVKDKAIKHQEKGLFLNVNKHNKARFFYEKIGFTISEAVVLDIGNGYVMDDYIMEFIF